MISVIRDKIAMLVSEWNPDLQRLAGNNEIMTIHFGAQEVDDDYELYLSGHTWYDGHDLWILYERYI